jgi:glucose-6-phosphate isomerase
VDALETNSEWTQLLATMPPSSLQHEFSRDDARARKLSLSAVGLHIDYSKQLVNDEVMDRLVSLARARQTGVAFEQMAQGDPINFTEDRAVGHMALRSPRGQSYVIGGRDVAADVHRVLDQMTAFAQSIRSGEHLGTTGLRIRTVVNIGIGGSDLGPVMVYEALRSDRTGDIDCRFVANVDPADLADNLRGLDPAETLFVIASKTFTTVETLANARAARAWLVSQLGEAAVEKHFVAVSTNTAAVQAFGIDTKNMFEFWDWVGGRYSVPSAIGLSVMIAIGPEVFGEFLGGMHEMDLHARRAEGRANAPLILALLNVWNTAALGARSRGIIPYSYDLRRFPAYLQQLIMESNGKSVRKDGSRVGYPTSPVIWGEPGTNGQHAFMQLLHQGTDIVPVDFIGFARSTESDRQRTELLFTNMLAQSQALAFGRSIEQLRDQQHREHRVFDGNRPSTTIVAQKLTPAILGQLIALYEHVVFFEGVIWDINSFDQWGVELGKELATSLGVRLTDFSSPDHRELDSSTHILMSWFAQHRSIDDPPTQ